MVSDKDKLALNLYAALMGEVKIRLLYLDDVIGGRTGLSGHAIQEFGFLQLRYLCELIALGCLTAHGDVSGTKKLRKEFAAGRIVTELGKLHPEFYPRPVKRISTGPASYHLASVKAGFLTKAELLLLDSKCGSHLHRGNAKNLLSNKSPLQANFPEIVSWHRKIEALLTLHHLSLYDGRHFLCALRRPKESVQAVLAEPLGEVEFVP